jgi:hypothetical protein
MSGSTSVPTPTFGPNGFVAPAESAILAGVQADLNAAFGGKLNFSTSTGSQTNATPQGQIAASTAAIVGDANTQQLAIYNGVDPALASGRMQDAVGRIYFLTRLPALSTTLQIACVGLAAVVIPVGALISDTSGYVYSCTTAGTIPSSGTITLSFACVTTGAIPVPGVTSVSIYQSIPNWDTVSCLSGVIGRPVESRAAFEMRRSQSVAANATQICDAVLGTVLQVPGVVDAYVIDNPVSVAQTVGGVSLNANSLYVCVAGGFAPLAVAQAIWTKKPPGCAYTGNTTETVTDPNPLYSTPPTYAVSFETAINTPLLFAVTIKNSASVPSTAMASIVMAINNAFSGADGGTVPRLGAEIFASRFYAGIASLGSWAQIISIQIGCQNVPAASFTGYISGTALLVTSVASGALAIGQFLTDTTGAILPGTQILSGGGSVWSVNMTQTVASEAMFGVAANQNDVTMNINQEPTFAAANVTLTLV